MAVLTELALYLQGHSLGTLASTLFLYGLPEDAPAVSVQDALIALVPVPGLASVHTHGGLAWTQPVIQVLVRGNPYGEAAAEGRADAAFLVLEQVHNMTLTSAFYLEIRPLQPPFLLKRDAMARPILAFSVRCQRAA